MNEASLNEKHCPKHDHKHRTLQHEHSFRTVKHNQFIPGS